jgi:hypothetical protein
LSRPGRRAEVWTTRKPHDGPSMELPELPARSVTDSGRRRKTGASQQDPQATTMPKMASSPRWNSPVRRLAKVSWTRASMLAPLRPMDQAEELYCASCVTRRQGSPIGRGSRHADTFRPRPTALNELEVAPVTEAWLGRQASARAHKTRCFRTRPKFAWSGEYTGRDLCRNPLA